MKKVLTFPLVVLAGAGLFYAAYVLPSQMLSNPSHTTAPEVTRPSDTTAPQVTRLPQYVVISEVLEKRSGAGEQYANVGYLQRGEPVTVYEFADADGGTCHTWARIGEAVWVCADMLEVRP